MGLHRDVAEDNMHEPKGTTTLTGGASDIGKVIVSKGDGSTETRLLKNTDLDPAQVQSRMGIWDYNDLATATTPITLAPAATYVKLTNDEAGPGTNKLFKLPEVADVWNSTTDQFDFTDLSLGDVVDIRFDVTVTTTGGDHVIEMQLDVGIGDAGNYQLQVHREQFKASGTFRIIKMFSMYIGDITTKDFPTEIMAKADLTTADTLVVNGWFIEVQTRSNY